MKTTLKLFTFAILIALIAVPSFAQGTLLTSTTFSAAVTATATQVTLASATGVNVQGVGNQFNTALYVDRELFYVKSLISGTTYSVVRGQGGTRPQAHLSGAKVWLGPLVGNFVSISPIEAEVVGACVSTAPLTLPLIFVRSGHRYDCLGASGTQQWTLVSSNEFPVLGTTVASPAGVMAATGTVFIVSGTNAVTGITLPKGAQPGFTLTVIPSGVFTWTTATNIALAGTAVVNKALFFVWSGTAWIPSYIA